LAVKQKALENLYAAALTELGSACSGIDDNTVDRATLMIAEARNIIVFGAGRERLQIMGFAMRLFHLGLKVSVVGDMTTPPAGKGDLFIATVGPGELSTASALLNVAKNAGAKTLVITAQPKGHSVGLADAAITIPAQTMANDQGPLTATLPMGSIFEGALFVLFEVMILKLRDRLGVTPETMRANHTNLE
jgi:6-phospho-3-hexuloisomerase